MAASGCSIHIMTWTLLTVDNRYPLSVVYDDCVYTGKALQPYDIIRAIDGRSVLKQVLRCCNSTMSVLKGICKLEIGSCL